MEQKEFNKYWISVTDVLPNDSREVLVADINYDGGYYGIASYSHTNGWAINGTAYWRPSHWIDIPKLPSK